jgi:hypothetical protein
LYDAVLLATFRIGSKTPDTRMSRSTLFSLAFPALVAAGCPAYDDGCYRDRDCAPGYECRRSTGVCEQPQKPREQRCDEPADCSGTCDRFGRCRAEGCDLVGCVSGYTCESSGPEPVCVGSAAAGGAGGESGAGGAAGAR